jgi:hypothetical protein
MGFENHEYKSEFARDLIAEGRAKGKAEGKAEAIVAFLLARDLSVSDGARSFITSCTNLELLNAWSAEAATVDSVAELFR